MAYVMSGIVGVDLTATPTDSSAGEPMFTVGQTVTTQDASVYQYVHANGAIAQYDFVGIDENGEAAKITKAMADDGWQVGVAQVAFTDNDYGWAAIRGSNISGNVLASCAADSAVYTSATAGSLDDTSASQTKIDGVVCVASRTSGSAGSVEVLLTYPKSTTF